MTALDSDARTSPDSSGTDAYEKAMNKAMRLLAVRDRSTGQLAERLRGAGFDPATSNAVIARLLELELLDDHRYAERQAESALRAGKSRSAAVKTLKGEGIDAEGLVETIAQEVDGHSESDRAYELATQRASRYKGLPKQTAYRRLASFLASRGFDQDIVGNVCRQTLGELEISEG